jgi:hypothetical protein
MFLGYASPQNFEFPPFCQAHLLATAGTELRQLISVAIRPLHRDTHGLWVDGDSHIANNLRVNKDPTYSPFRVTYYQGSLMRNVIGKYKAESGALCSRAPESCRT